MPDTPQDEYEPVMEPSRRKVITDAMIRRLKRAALAFDRLDAAIKVIDAACKRNKNGLPF